MKYTSILAIAATLINTSVAYYVPGQPYSTLTPTATYSGASTDYTQSFGIQILTLTSASATAAAKRDVNQIDDGQIQAQTTSSAQVINQIGDGQIQHQTTASAAQVINQIGDGQIQHQTTASAAQVINQIGDGQIQHQTTTTASVVNQIGDGQIQHQTTLTTSTITGASQITDGQVQAPTASSEAITDGLPEACLTPNSLAMTLNGSILTDSHGRVGSIVANRQFQFDGPPPQAGAIYAAGWSVTSDGFLALGDSDVFYQCLSGDFYNLYDENVAAQCEPVKLSVIDLVAC
ncbi:hypothetical protein DFJ63DRAFT_216622 [Scheffersomyces coipomensis]|uniref:uncharacterized protein n=1 Tax=Scheffersomyces coipomensis TaxID=1788519 RepID=UPI00315DA198